MFRIKQARLFTSFYIYQSLQQLILLNIFNFNKLTFQLYKPLTISHQL